MPKKKNIEEAPKSEEEIKAEADAAKIKLETPTPTTRSKLGKNYGALDRPIKTIQLYMEKNRISLPK